MKNNWDSQVKLYSATLGAIVKQKPDITFNTNRNFPNGKKAPDGIELRFGIARPTEAVRALLKAHGFRFSEKQKIWYAVHTVKSKALADKLSEEEVEVDTTEYEKKHFWVRVKHLNEFNKLTNYTEFWLKEESPKFFYNKKLLQKVYPNVSSLIYSEKLYFKKFYNKIVGEDDQNEEEVNEDETPTPTNQNEHLGIAEKLKELAESMQKAIDAKINSATSKQRPTAKRLRVAAGMREQGYELQDIQQILFSLSQAHFEQKIKDYPFLKAIRNKVQVALVKLYGDYIKNKWSDTNIQSSFERQKDSLNSLGINSVFEWSVANTEIGELLNAFSSGKRAEETQTEKKLKELEAKIFSQKISGFFPTPKPLIERLLNLADLKLSHYILEPSAGKGDIVDAIQERFNGNHPRLSVCEVNVSLVEILKLKKHTLIGTDFLTVTKKFDRIVMNPPFENGLDVDHVLHAYSLLQTNGRVVAIMSEGVFYRQFKKDSAFREFLNQNNAYISEPIKEAFKSSFISTGVNVRIVAINKNSTPVETKNNQPSTTHNEYDTELLELEAQAEIELLKLQVELARKRQSTLKGLGTVDTEKIKYLRQKAWALQNKLGVLNFK